MPCHAMPKHPANCQMRCLNLNPGTNKIPQLKDDQEGARNVDDDNFIDDSGVDPANRHRSDNEHSPSRAPRAEEGEKDDELKELFNMGKRKKKTEKSAGEIALLVENVMSELEVVAEEDAELNK